MTLDSDSIAARRRLRRSLSLWRIAAVLAAGLAILALAFTVGGDGLKRRTDHIARVRVKAVIIDIDSPGGTTAGSEAIYEAIRKIAAKKPVVSVMGTIAASGGYITAIASDYIVARGNTITGSIGVIFQWAQLQKLLDTLGVQMQEVKSGDLKAEPNFFKPPSEKALAVANGMPRRRMDGAKSAGFSFSRTDASIPAVRRSRRSSSMPWAARTRRSTGCARKRRSPTPSRSSIGSPMTRAPPSVSDS